MPLSAFDLIKVCPTHLGRVAQLVEHSTLNRLVVGSIPTASTISLPIQHQFINERFAIAALTKAVVLRVETIAPARAKQSSHTEQYVPRPAQPSTSYWQYLAADC